MQINNRLYSHSDLRRNSQMHSSKRKNNNASLLYFFALRVEVLIRTAIDNIKLYNCLFTWGDLFWSLGIDTVNSPLELSFWLELVSKGREIWGYYSRANNYFSFLVIIFSVTIFQQLVFTLRFFSLGNLVEHLPLDKGLKFDPMGITYHSRRLLNHE